MLSPEQENCPPSRSRFWNTREGLITFMAMVSRLAPNESIDRQRSRDELHLALRASDFVAPTEVDDRVQSAARILAERLQAETYRITKRRQFVLQPQPFRPDVLYGEFDSRTRDALDNNITTAPQHNFFAQYLEEQNALRRASAAKSHKRYSAPFT